MSESEKLSEREEETMMTLEECPIGLFVCDDELCLKTEYGNNNGRIDAYIVSSGEFFWGGTDKPSEQRKVMVEPVENVTLYKRPVAFRIPETHGSGWIILQSEDAAQIEAEHRGVEYQGLYVRDDCGTSRPPAAAR